jgi:hypothetical protein
MAVGQAVTDANRALGEAMLPYLEKIAEKFVEIADALGVKIPDFIYEVADALKAWQSGLIDVIDLLSMALNMFASLVGTDAADAAMKGAGGTTDQTSKAGQARTLEIVDNAASLALGSRDRRAVSNAFYDGTKGLGSAIGTGVDLASLGFKTTAETARSVASTAQGFAFGPQGSDARNAALAGLSGRPATQMPVTVSAPVTVTIQGNADERTVKAIQDTIRGSQDDMLRNLQNELLGTEL